MRRRQRAQIAPFAVFAMLILTGAVALVVDAGIFFVTKQQLQNAVDAAALAAVWYDNICDPITFGTRDPTNPGGCEPRSRPAPPSCAVSQYVIKLPKGVPDDADCAADRWAEANMGYVGKLCTQIEFIRYGKRRTTPVRLPNTLAYYQMEINCEAPYWFARVFPSIPATTTITAHASATVGFATSTGEASARRPPGPSLTGMPQLVARLAD
jgi:hypothetical protein